jgi:ubiquinone biosynthesis protein COQ9
VIAPPERSPARDAAIDAVVPHVHALGWSRAALCRAVGEDGLRLFPVGGPDLVEAYIDLLDRRMAAHAAAAVAEARLSHRVRLLIATRLRLTEMQKPAMRRAALMLALPQHTALAVRCTARTIDAIWHAAGDTSADITWYTKRAILSAVYCTTLFYWMNDATTQSAALDFLDRRLAAVARFQKFRTQVAKSVSRAAAVRA